MEEERLSDAHRILKATEVAEPVFDEVLQRGERLVDFLARHELRFSRNPRRKYLYMNLAREDAEELGAIRRRAEALKTLRRSFD